MIDLLEAGNILEELLKQKLEVAERKLEGGGDRSEYHVELSRLMDLDLKVVRVSDGEMLDLILRLIREETGSSVALTDNGKALH